MGIQKLNKKGIDLKLGMYAIIVFGMIITAVGIWISSYNTSYGSGLTYDLGDLNKLDTISAEAKSQENRLSPETAEPATDFETSTFRGAYAIINNVFTPFRAVFGNNGMLDSITERFGMPDYFRQGIVTMMSFSIIFAIIYIIFRIPGGTT